MNPSETRQDSSGRYVLKASSFSSHSLILSGLPRTTRGEAVLDVGAGEGYLSAILAHRGYRVVCIVEPGTASPLLPQEVRIVEADLDITRPDLQGVFDFVVCGDILEHLRDPSATLRWLRVCTKPGGVLIASLPNGVHLYVRIHVLLGMFPRHDRGLFDRTHLHFFSWSGWRRLLCESGFEVVASRVTAIPFSLLLSGPFVRRGAWMLEAASYLLARAWRGMFAYQFVVSARPSQAPAPGE